MNLIEINNLTIKFRTSLLEDISFTFHNANYLIKGNNGCGKTTLIRAITKCADINSGTINRFKTTISYFYQEVLLFHYLTVNEYIMCMANEFNDELLLLLEIDFLDVYIKKLSTGQVNKVLLYLTFAQKADFYIIDEIINAIDNGVKLKVVKYLGGLQSGNFILVTHDKSLCDIIENSTKVVILKIENKKILTIK
ncbi:MAG: ATP-binding cassette domain-containing protein [Bacilli bacterium]